MQIRIRPALAAVLAACVALPTLAAVAPAAASGRTHYVATNGSDGNPGTLTSPWRTLNKSLPKLSAGDTLYVRGGTYREGVGWGIRRGTSTAPIRLYAYRGERVVIVGHLKLVNADYWYVNRINVTRDPNKPVLHSLVKFTNGTGWRFMNGEVWGARGVSNMMVNSTTAGKPSHYRITGNCIHDNDATGSAFMNYHNIYLYPGYKSGPGLIERNILFNAENGDNIKAAGPDKSTGAAYVTIRYNSMARAGQGILIAYGTHHVTAYRNLIVVRRGGSSWYPAIRGYQVSGYGNVAKYNAASRYDSVLRSTSSKRPIKKGNGNRLVSTGFDSVTSCSGFHPTSSTARAYGRYA